MENSIRNKRQFLNLVSNLDDKLKGLTLTELINKFKLEVDELDTKKAIQEDSVISEFTNTYLKLFEENSLFGDEIQILHVKTLKTETYTTEWERTYLLTGTRMVFHKGGFYRTKLDTSVHSTYTEKQLKSATKITKEEYNQYSKNIDEMDSIISKNLSKKNNPCQT